MVVSTIHHHLPATITSTPELRLTHRLRLYEARHFFYVSILSLRWCSSLSMSYESKPKMLNPVHEAKTRDRWARWSLIKLKELMGVLVKYLDAHWCGGTTLGMH
ncbi:hypothetical protein PIB30_079710 [Stylosanthes scabra]|uniref:Uncharacterized protein n=1 Tax=Stylosanthes scabra TaxID=79078 RepID=A0ABU6WPG9_9FABA|nr:hypothetical protein [Stylosanthes scabra]